MTSNGLLGSTTLDVVVGLVFVYLLLAIICTTMNEWIAGIFNTRSTTLQAAIKQLLDRQPGDKDSGELNWFLQQFYNHPLISAITRPGKRDSHPAYIAPRMFATAVMDIVTPQKPGVIAFHDLETGIGNLPDGEVKQALLALIQTCNGDLNQAQRNIQAWYDDTMQRVSGWYKRRTQLWTVLVATFLTLAANADTLQIAKTLWREPTLRALVVEQAKNRTATDAGPGAADTNHPPKPAIQPVVKDEVNTLGEVMGWTHQSLLTTPAGWADRVLGWFLSIVAISLGAPFWFDLLNKFMRIRNGGDAPEEMPTPPQRPQTPDPAPLAGKAGD